MYKISGFLLLKIVHFEKIRMKIVGIFEYYIIQADRI